MSILQNKKSQNARFDEQVDSVRDEVILLGAGRGRHKNFQWENSKSPLLCPVILHVCCWCVYYFRFLMIVRKNSSKHSGARDKTFQYLSFSLKRFSIVLLKGRMNRPHIISYLSLGSIPVFIPLSAVILCNSSAA